MIPTPKEVYIVVEYSLVQRFDWESIFSLHFQKITYDPSINIIIVTGEIPVISSVHETFQFGRLQLLDTQRFGVQFYALEGTIFGS